MPDKIEPFDFLINTTKTEKLWWAEARIAKLEKRNIELIAKIKEQDTVFTQELKEHRRAYSVLEKRYKNLLKNSI